MDEEQARLYQGLTLYLTIVGRGGAHSVSDRSEGGGVSYCI